MGYLRRVLLGLLRLGGGVLNNLFFLILKINFVQVTKSLSNNYNKYYIFKLKKKNFNFISFFISNKCALFKKSLPGTTCKLLTRYYALKSKKLSYLFYFSENERYRFIKFVKHL